MSLLLFRSANLFTSPRTRFTSSPTSRPATVHRPVVHRPVVPFRPFVYRVRVLLPVQHSDLLPFTDLSFTDLPPFKHLVRMDANTQNQTWCTKCNALRESESFEKNKSGETKKLCNRHGKKRDLEAVFDDWNAFETQLNEWSHPVSNRLNLFFCY